MSFPFGATLTIHARAVTSYDTDGNDVVSDTDSTSAGWVLSPSSTTEATQGRDTVTYDVLATTKGLVGIAATDEVSVMSGPYVGRYQIVGAPSLYSHPITGTKVTELRLSRVTG